MTTCTVFITSIRRFTVRFGYDYIVNKRSGLLLLKKTQYEYHPDIEFVAHDSRRDEFPPCVSIEGFALELLKDLQENREKTNMVHGQKVSSEQYG